MSPRPGRITDIVSVDLGAQRDDTTREEGEFFKKITEVREALRVHGPARQDRVVRTGRQDGIPLGVEDR
jgi:hypothetical protein